MLIADGHIADAWNGNGSAARAKCRPFEAIAYSLLLILYYITMKFSIESTASYNSIHPAYHYTEQFGNNSENYQDGTKWYGVFLAFLSGTFFTVSSALVKAVRNVDPMVLLAIRALVQMLAMGIVACRTSNDLFGPSGRRILIHFQVKFHLSIHSTQSHPM